MNRGSIIAKATASQDELIKQIGGFLFSGAKKTALEEKGDENLWNYCVLVATQDSLTPSLFYEKEYFGYNFDSESNVLLDSIRQFRDAVRADCDQPFVVCKIAISKQSKHLIMLLEYDDEDKWKIGPANLHRRYEILLGDIYPEALTERPKIIEKPSFLKRLFGR